MDLMSQQSSEGNSDQTDTQKSEEDVLSAISDFKELVARIEDDFREDTHDISSDERC